MLMGKVAGGIAYGSNVFDTLVKEAEEEASLNPHLVERGAVATGAVSYFYVRDACAGGEVGLLQPEVEYVYDLAVSEDIIPEPNDDEVESFILMAVDEVCFRIHGIADDLKGARAYCGRRIQAELCICLGGFFGATWDSYA